MIRENSIVLMDGVLIVIKILAEVGKTFSVCASLPDCHSEGIFLSARQCLQRVKRFFQNDKAI